MGWLQRLFGINNQQANNQQANRGQQAPMNAGTQQSSGGEQVPPERMGLNGEYDQSGLAKRVALAFDQDPNLDDIDTLFVAQTGTTVVLKGKAPNQQILSKMVSVAQGVQGATSVDTSQVNVG